MEIYGLKTCDTCRKAIKALPDAHFVDVRADGVPTDVMDAALATFGEKLVNTRSTTWRGLSEEERKGAPKDLLAAHPTLMKRPLIATNGSLHLGWTKDVQAALGVD
ncbi:MULTISPECIES: ArsC/Spx/MgsR family protein [Roseobacteraceae]|uniref:ArsC/Spx/MgsR family protein n=1 Tax=Roseobacteraceae TaxID=2854170 RepID=UPI001C46EE13|nr:MULTISPECIES: ArsC/Spx/MgsR family protein [Roseobacteraceae]MBV7408884.1 arsenate reductase [Maritimibacter sp. DP1N21-5]MBY5934429.1 arsenate reductase [Tateyamaria omphalii]